MSLLLKSGYCLVLLGIAFLLLVVQEFVPPMEWLQGARLVLVPIIVVYAGLALPFPLVLLFTFVSGLMWDLLIYRELGGVAEISPGTSILVYTLVGIFAHGFRPLFMRGRWEIHCLLSGFCTVVMIAVEYAMITFRRSEISYDTEVLWRIGGPGLVAILLAPVFYVGLGLLGQLMHCELQAEEEESFTI